MSNEQSGDWRQYGQCRNRRYWNGLPATCDNDLTTPIAYCWSLEAATSVSNEQSAAPMGQDRRYWNGLPHRGDNDLTTPIALWSLEAA